jgi:hypothetical protein
MITVASPLDIPSNAVRAVTQPDGSILVYMPGDPLPTVVPEPAQVPQRRVTRLAFRNRFTPTEKVAIELAQLDVSTAPTEQRLQAAWLRASQTDVMAGAFVDLDRADTRAGVNQLEAVGLLATGRAMQILDAPVQPDEVPE